LIKLAEIKEKKALYLCPIRYNIMYIRIGLKYELAKEEGARKPAE
jgi:hypothetical protein